ncbi:MAG TPA: L,D-transpeptidase family protein [Xanthobacteraceae bacterium]|nr:L,D-transpeptidase family protein [Xanthobacteraceae bacterium]
MKISSLARTLLAPAAIAATVALAGCDTDGVDLSARALAPIPQKTLALMAEKNMTKEAPILVRIFKEESELEVWKQDSSGKFALLKSYPICRWSGDLGPKIKEGDRQAPEGFYTITPGQMNPHSQYYLAFNIGFPNAYDQANGRTGDFLMIHGDCSSRGCYAMTDEQIAELYALARESFFAGQDSFQIQAYPFRMTPENMAKHRNNPNIPFWKMLKEGYDHFEVTHLQPKVDVCDRHYVFDAALPEGSALKFNPRGKCPEFTVPEDIAIPVAEKEQRDNLQTAMLIQRGIPTVPFRTGVDGGMNPVFLAALQGGRPVTDSDGNTRRIPVSAPGTIPDDVNPPTPVAVAADNPSPSAAPASSATTARSKPGSVQPPAAQSAAVAAAPVQAAAATPAKSQTFLTSLFTSENSPDASKGSILDRAAAAVGLRGSAPPPEPSLAPAAKPEIKQVAKPAATKTVATKPPAAKPRPLPATTVAQSRPQPVPQPAAAPVRAASAAAIRPRETQTAAAGETASAGLLTGAAPVVPAGSFGTGFSTLR